MVKIGDRIELVYTNDPYTSLKPGDKGTVGAIERIEFLKETQIWVKWDSGSNLTLIQGVDQFKIIK